MRLRAGARVLRVASIGRGKAATAKYPLAAAPCPCHAAAPPSRPSHRSATLACHLGRRLSPRHAAGQAFWGGSARCASASAATEGAIAAAPTTTGKRQPVDYTTVVAIAAELNRDWVPAKVEQALQVDAFTLVIRLRTMDSATWLHLSRHDTGCHMAVGEAPVRGNAAEAFSFGEQVHQQLRGLVLLGASVPFPWERIICLDFATRIAEDPTRRIYFEVTGRYSNIVLVDAAAHILTAAIQVGSKMSSVRAVRAGERYAPPPLPPGIPPDAGQPGAEWRATVEKVGQMLQEQRGRGATVAEAMVRGWQGVSPSLAKELCIKAGVPPDAGLAEVASAPQWESLHGAWLAWLRALEEGQFEPCVDPGAGGYSVLGSYAQPEASLHALLRSYYSSVQGTQMYGQQLSTVQTAVKGARKKVAAKLAQLRKQMGGAGQEADVQKRADLLMGHLHLCEPGMAQVEVEDWETGELVQIALDPLKSAVEVAEGLYRRAGKMRRSVAQVEPLLRAAEEEAAYLEEVDYAVQSLGSFSGQEDLYTLIEIRDELVAGKYMRAPPEATLEAKGASKGRRAQKRGKGKPAEGVPREYCSPSGFTVLVGRNNRQNDALTRAAAESDLWLHARGVPGSHVIVKLPSGGKATEEDKAFAANLAAGFSKAKNGGRVEVICVTAANVKRPKGAPPGRVALLREDVVIGQPALAPSEP